MSLNPLTWDPLLYSIVLSALPISELRGGIPLAIAGGYPIWLVFVVCALANIAIILPVWFFLDYLHVHLEKLGFYKRFSDRILDNVRKRTDKIEANMKLYGWLALTIFVGVPLPVTGAYTASLAVWILALERKKSFVFIALGVLVSASIVTLVTVGAINFFKI